MSWWPLEATEKFKPQFYILYKKLYSTSLVNGTRKREDLAINVSMRTVKIGKKKFEKYLFARIYKCKMHLSNIKV